MDCSGVELKAKFDLLDLFPKRRDAFFLEKETDVSDLSDFCRSRSFCGSFSDKSDKSVSLLFPFFLGNHRSHRLEGFFSLTLVIEIPKIL